MNGNYASAIGFYSNAIECVPTDPAFYNNRAHALM